MTNEQLAILLAQYARHLKTALAHVDAGLPEGTERHIVGQKYVGEVFDLSKVISSKPSTHPNDWVQAFSSACILDPICEVLTDLRTSVEWLRRGRENIPTLAVLEGAQLAAWEAIEDSRACRGEIAPNNLR